MSEVRVLVAEDEAPQRRALVELLADVWPSANIVAVCADGRAAADAFERHVPSVAFLDIRMPGVDGLELARRYGEHAHIVFVTAYDEHAIAAFEQGAVGYVLKPVQRDRLEVEVRRLQRRLSEGAPQRSTLERIERIETVVETLRALTSAAPLRPLRWITANVGETVRLFPIHEVIAFRSRDKYTEVLTTSGDAVIRKSLKELAEQLEPDEFWQVHRSALVRASAIDRVERDDAGKFRVVLRGCSQSLPVSAAFRSRLRGM